MCGVYPEFSVAPIMPFLILLMSFDHVSVKGKDKREATLTADPYSDKVSSK